MAGKGKKPTRSKQKPASLENVVEYRHKEATRKNNPPAKIAAEGVVPLMAKIKYEYSPRLAPVLRFDPDGSPDKLPELLKEARRRPLTSEETKLLMEALRNQEPWLEWATKKETKSFEVDPVALHIHERVSPQAILRVAARQDIEPSLFADPQQQYHEAVQFYRHEIPWTNRLILGDGLQVMTSLSHREDLAGKVQMIYMDPPYGIKFGSNFQPEVGNQEVKEREQDLTREPETVKAYRDTWHLGVHSYLSYLRDRLSVAKELLTDTGSIFIQISDQNLHRVRAVMDEVFGPQNQIVTIVVKKKGNQKGGTLEPINDYLLWYARDRGQMKSRGLFLSKLVADQVPAAYNRVAMPNGDIRKIDPDDVDSLRELIESGAEVFTPDQLTSGGEFRTQMFDIAFEGRLFKPAKNNSWKLNEQTMARVIRAGRVVTGESQVRFKKLLSDFGNTPLTNLWEDLGGAADKVYVVQTNTKIIQRCLLMTTEPGDLVLDPTCGSGTTAYVAELWGRRWITVDTSRVAIAIARQRLMTSKFDFYRLRDESVGIVSNFKYKTVPHITLTSIAQNTNLDPIFDKYQPSLDKALARCNAELSHVDASIRQKLQEKLVRKQREHGRKAISDADYRRWELPENNKNWEHWQMPFDTDPDWPKSLIDSVMEYRRVWRVKMDEVSSCIATNAEQEELVDQPEKVNGIVRVSGPFTVEAVQPPEMMLGAAETVTVEEFDGTPEEMTTFEALREVETRADQEAQNIEAYLDQMMRLLKMDGVRFPNNKELRFHRLELVLDGSVIHAEGRWSNGETDKDPEGKANIGVVFGPQYGPITAMQVEEAIRQANRRGYDQLVLAGFSFDGAAQAVINEAQHPKLKVHAAHIRPDVNPGMAGLLKEQPGSQLFSVFGQPRTKVEGPDRAGEYTVTMEGVDIYNPVDNKVTPTKADKVAAWFLDGDYDGRTFCITQAFFPDRSAWEKLSKALDGIVDPERFEALSGTRSLPFPPGKHKSVSVKVIDPRGNEVMIVHKLDGKHGR